MKCILEKSRRLIRKQGVIAIALVAGLGILGACSSSDDEEAGFVPSTGPLAYNFDAKNAVTAAEIAAAAMSFFPGFTAVSQVVIDRLLTDEPVNSPFDLMLCNGSGDSILTWDDADRDTDLSIGDTASLQFTNCDFDTSGETVTGTVDIDATSVSVALPAVDVGYAASVDLTISLVPDTTDITADFNARMSSPDGNSFTSVYTAADAPGKTLAVTENGTGYFTLGCFNVTQTYDLAGLGAGTYNLDPAPLGAINASEKVFSLARGPVLSFIADAFESGTQRLLSLSAPDCASIGAPNGVPDSDGSYLDMIALGGGNLMLRIFDVDNIETSSIPTTWDSLTN